MLARRAAAGGEEDGTGDAAGDAAPGPTAPSTREPRMAGAGGGCIRLPDRAARSVGISGEPDALLRRMRAVGPVGMDDSPTPAAVSTP